MAEKEILVQIKRYQFIKATIRGLEERLESISCKTTPTYGEEGGMSGDNTSKTEKTAIKRVDILCNIRKKEQILKTIENYIENSGLNQMEKEVLWEVAKNGNLQSYARKNILCKSYVYKIRDKAVKKIFTRLQNVRN